MCLHKVTQRRRPSEKVVVGYKIFNVEAVTGDLHFQNGSRRSSNFVPRGRWIKATGKPFLAHKNFWDSRRYPGYKSGFHAYARPYRPELGPALNTKVLLRSVRTVGTQNSRKVLVADWLYVPRASEKIVGTRVVKK